MKVFVIGSGQSNAMGGQGGEGGDQTVNSRVFAWDPVTSAWVVATLGQSPFPPADPGMLPRNNAFWNFCKKYQEEHDCDVYFVLSGQGNTALPEWSAPSGPQWIALDAAAKAAQASVEIGGKPADFFLWFQGEAGSGNSTYKADFLTLRNNAIASGWVNAETPWIAGEIISDISASKTALLSLLADRDATWFNMAMNENISRVGPAFSAHFTGPGYVNYGRGPFFAAAKQMPRMPSPYFRPWVPVINGSAANPTTINYDDPENFGGSYKIDNMVVAWFKIKLLNIVGGSGTVYISGLPYPIGSIAPARSDYMQTAMGAEVGGLSLAVPSPIIIKTAGANGFKLQKVVAGGNTANLLISDLSATFTMCGSVTYFVD